MNSQSSTAIELLSIFYGLIMIKDKGIQYIDTSSKSPAGIAKSHRLIRIQKDKEIQFLKLCAMIELDDYKVSRAINQRDDRRAKRLR